MKQQLTAGGPQKPSLWHYVIAKKKALSHSQLKRNHKKYTVIAGWGLGIMRSEKEEFFLI